MSASAPQTATDPPLVRDEQLSAVAIWEQMIRRVPTLLGKLVSVASFHGVVSGEYRHPALDRNFSPETVSRVLRESHEHLFAEWVGLFIEEQGEELERYFANLPKENARDLLLKAGESLIPPSTNAVVRRAFLNDLEQILGGKEAAGGLRVDPDLVPAVA